MGATGRYRVLWGDFASVEQALRKKQSYLNSGKNVRPQITTKAHI